jgi:hypothetical protein
VKKLKSQWGKQMTKDEALRLALVALKTIDDAMPFPVAKLAIKECTAALEAKDEPVAVKHMMRWVDGLKRQSDNGRYMDIPSCMNSGTCWELANELEQFINTTPPQRTWVGLTDEEVGDLSDFAYANDEEFVRQVEKHLKEKNT